MKQISDDIYHFRLQTRRLPNGSREMARIRASITVTRSSCRAQAVVPPHCAGCHLLTWSTNLHQQGVQGSFHVWDLHMPHHRGKRTAAPKAQLAADQHVFDLGPSRRRRRLARALVPGRGGGVFREKSRRGGFCFALLHVNCRRRRRCRRRSPCPSGPSSRHVMSSLGFQGISPARIDKE